MGQQMSSSPSFPARSSNFRYFSVTFCKTDIITVVDASDEVLSIIRDVLSRYSPRGIEKEEYGDESGAGYFKLEGTPFGSDVSQEEAAVVEFMVCEMLKELRMRGWELTLSSDLSRTSDLSTLFFQKTFLNVDDGCEVLCVNLIGQDRLQLINGPPEADSILIDCVGGQYQKHSSEGFFEITLQGYLWAANTSEECFLARRILLNIFHRLHDVGFRYYGTANLKGNADCIFFIKDYHGFGSREYFMLSLDSMNRLRLIGAPNEAILRVGSCVERYWSKGIQNTRDMRESAFYEYQLKGEPWCASGSEANETRLMLTVIMQDMITVGWAVVTALDVSRRPNDKAVFVFHRCASANVPHFTLIPSGTDKIKLINATEDIRELVKLTIRNSWTLGILYYSTVNGNTEFVVRGNPWLSSVENLSNQLVLSRMMMTRILAQFAERGWRVICSADVSAKYEEDSKSNETYPVDIPSWFVAYTGIEGEDVGNADQQRPVPSAPDGVAPSAPVDNDPPPSYEEVMRSDVSVNQEHDPL